RLADRKISLEFSDAALEWLVRTGYDPSYGARPLKRAIQKEIENPLAKKLISGEVRDGQTVKVELNPLRAGLDFNPPVSAMA
ncbi:MAG: hypothetical protein ACK5UT_11485, partial [Acidobacteriota bacterium]